MLANKESNTLELQIEWAGRINGEAGKFRSK